MTRKLLLVAALLACPATAAYSGEVHGKVTLTSRPGDRKVGPDFVWNQPRYANLRGSGGYADEHHSRNDGPAAGVLEGQDEVANSVVEIVGVLPLTPLKKEIIDRNVMVQHNKNFEPHVMVVPKGSNVYFWNKDNILHHVYSVPKDPPGFEIPEHRGKREQGFPQAGAFELFCGLHPRMNGYVYVSESNFASKPDGQHHFHFANVPAGKYKVKIWHPRIKSTKVVEITVPAQGNVNLDLDL